MIELASIAAASLILLFLPSLAFARDVTGDDAVSCIACSGAIFTPLLFFLINIIILAWIAGEIRARGMSSPAGWLILIFFTGILGLIIFILSRPKGTLERCPHCGNKRLKAMVKCPYCGK